jgi:molybdate transport system substrate-binding protein
LVVITPAVGERTIVGVPDLAAEGLRLALVRADTPMGEATVELLSRAGIAEQAAANVVAVENDAMGVLQRVALGQVDAGIVYRSDASGPVSTDLRTIAVPRAMRVGRVLGVATVVDESTNRFAAPFVTYLRGGAQEVLRDAGFLPP